MEQDHNVFQIQSANPHFLISCTKFSGKIRTLWKLFKTIWGQNDLLQRDLYEKNLGGGTGLVEIKLTRYEKEIQTSLKGLQSAQNLDVDTIDFEMKICFG